MKRDSRAAAKNTVTLDLDQDLDISDEPSSKKSKKHVYGRSINIVSKIIKPLVGVSNSKFHVTKKVSQQARQTLSTSNEEADFDKREAIYSDNREALCVEFRFAP